MSWGFVHCVLAFAFSLERQELMVSWCLELRLTRCRIGLLCLVSMACDGYLSDGMDDGPFQSLNVDFFVVLLATTVVNSKAR